MRLLLLALAVLVGAVLVGRGAGRAFAQPNRGRYLVEVMGCGDCHTPGYFLGKPDRSRLLGGSDVGFGIPGVGVFVGPNLTPDVETGLGRWSVEQIVTAFTKGVRPDGRILAPMMPWRSFASLTPADARSVAEYLKTLPAVKHKVAGPFGAHDVPSVPVLAVIPGEMFPKLPAP